VFLILCQSFTGAARALAGPTCREISQSHFGKRVGSETLDKSIPVYDLDEKTSTPPAPANLQREWDARKAKNQAKGVSLSGFFLASGETLIHGEVNKAPVIVVESSQNADLLRHEAWHAAYAKANPGPHARRARAEAEKSARLESFITAVQKIPQTSPASMENATKQLSQTLVDLSIGTDLEEALVGCLMLESPQTIATNRPAHYEHAKRSLQIAASPLQTLARMLNKAPENYASAKRELDAVLAKFQALNVRLDQLKPLPR
jgi:hypothetical protein